MGYPPSTPSPIAAAVWLQASKVTLSAIEGWVRCDIPVMLDVEDSVGGAVTARPTVFGTDKLGVSVEGNIEPGTGGEAVCITIARER